MHTHTYTQRLPIEHAYEKGKMCLAGKELFSVNNYNSSSQTWVLGWAATIPLWPANYCERNYESPHFILCSYTGANSWLSCLITACSIMLCSTNFQLNRIPLNVSGGKESCEILLKGFTKTSGKRQTASLRWQIQPPHGGWWVLFTVVWLTLPRGYKLLLERSWNPTQACGIQPGTLSVSGFDTAVWVPNAVQTDT